MSNENPKPRLAEEDQPGSHAAPVKSTSGEGFDSRDFRNALGSFATGVTIITARSKAGGLYGLTANSFTSVSLTPPLVLWSASLYANSLPAFQEGSHFVVNILAHDQIELSNFFAKTAEDKFAEIDHMIPECGAPVIIGAAAHFECRNEYRHYGGDHIIFIGHVERYAYTGKPTLLFCRGKYMRGEPLLPALTPAFAWAGHGAPPAAVPTRSPIAARQFLAVSFTPDGRGGHIQFD